MVFRPGILTGDSGWGEHASLGQGQGGSGVPVSDPGLKAGGTEYGHLDPWLVATCAEVTSPAPGEIIGGEGSGNFGSFLC